MLDDAYLRWLDQCEFSDPARTLLTDVSSSPLVRRVAGGRGNIHWPLSQPQRRENIVGSIIFVALFGLFLVVMGVIILRIIARMAFKWWRLQRDGVIVEGLIGTCSYTYYRNRRRPVYLVSYTYVYQGKTYSQQEDEVSEEFFDSFGQGAADREDAPRTFPLENKRSASVRCVSHHPSVSRIIDPTSADGSASNPVATISGIVGIACGLACIGLGLFLLLAALAYLLTKR